MHSSSDQPEINLNNPLGVVSFERESNNIRSSCQHISGMFKREQGLGFNMCSVTYKIKLLE